MKFSVLTYDFGRYGKPRPPKEIDECAEYVYVTDVDEPPSPFVRKSLKAGCGSPLLDCQYVKHHPFEFVSSDVVVVMDSSIEICRKMEPLVDAFLELDADAMFISNPFATDFMKEMNSRTWMPENKRCTAKQREIELEFLKRFDEVRLNIEGMFYILRKCDMTDRLMNSIVGKCDWLLKAGGIPRPCQVLYSATVANEFKDEVENGKIAFMSSWQIRGNGTLMRTYNNHHAGNVPNRPMSCRITANILGREVTLHEFRELDRIADVKKPTQPIQKHVDWDMTDDD